MEKDIYYVGGEPFSVDIINDNAVKHTRVFKSPAGWDTADVTFVGVDGGERTIVVDASMYGQKWSEADRWMAMNVIMDYMTRSLRLKKGALGYAFGEYQGAYALCVVPNDSAAAGNYGYVLRENNGRLMLILAIQKEEG